MLKLFNGLTIFTKMYVSEPADLHIFYIDIFRCVAVYRLTLGITNILLNILPRHRNITQSYQGPF